MSKKTLLQLTQSILSDMTSDLVNSITDTVESQQVAQIICDTFDEQFSDRLIPENQGIILLDGLADTNHPNYLKIPADVFDIFWIKYNAQETGSVDYRDVVYKDPQEFLQIMSLQGNTGSLTQITDFTGAKFNIVNNKCPSIWTSFDDETIIFDAWNNSIESTLQSSNSMCWGQTTPTASMSDSWVPPIDDNLFPLLLAEAESACFVNLRGSSNPKSEQRARRQATRSQKHLWKGNQRNYTGPDYGRNPR